MLSERFIVLSDLAEAVAKYGVGKWRDILDDTGFKFRPERTAVDLKDKWRNISAYKPYKERSNIHIWLNWVGIRQYLWLDEKHNPIRTLKGNKHIFSNRFAPLSLS